MRHWRQLGCGLSATCDHVTPLLSKPLSPWVPYGSAVLGFWCVAHGDRRVAIWKPFVPCHLLAHCDRAQHSGKLEVRGRRLLAAALL